VLTADLVRARRRQGKLVLTALKGAARVRAVEIASELLEVASVQVGETRATLLASLKATPVEASEQKLVAGLVKLLLDATEFESELDVDPVALRAEVFARASELRAETTGVETFDRDAVLAESAEARGLSTEDIERLLYADLRESQRILAAPALSGEQLVERYELGQAQAVLLRAERVQVDVVCASPAAYRALFHKLKFLRLLHRIERLPSGGYRVVIDGPYSLFASVTKYGRQLAMLLPTLRGCDRFALTADIRWGKDRSTLVFELEEKRRRGGDGGPAELPDELIDLMAAFERRGGLWSAAPSDEVFDLPGLGTCVPDLVFTHRETGESILFELLGYWSRDAVFRRVELVRAGLPVRILFGVPARLRVSESVLPEDLPASLLVFKNKLLAGPVVAALDELSGVVVKP